MKKISSFRLKISIFVLLILFLIITKNYGQVRVWPSSNVSVGTTVSQEPSAKLQVHSTDQGILIPRIAWENRGVITSPVDGLIVFFSSSNPDQEGIYYFCQSCTPPDWVKAGGDLNSNNETQTLTINGNQLSISMGNTVTLPTPNGSETIIEEGNNITISGIGTSQNPYVINSSALSGTVSGSGTPTEIAFWNSPNSISSNSNLFWDNINHRLGIGTSTPSLPLTVNGAGSLSGDLYVLGTIRPQGGWISSDAAGGLYIQQSTANPLVFNTNSTERMRISGTGDVGIGINNPAAKLDILGNVKVTSSSGISFYDSGGYGGGSIFGSYFYNQGEIHIKPLNTANPTVFSPNGGVTVGTFTQTPPTNGMAISGNVGVGTNNPQSKFHLRSTTAGSQFLLDDNGTGNGVAIRINSLATAYNWQIGAMYNHSGFEITPSTVVGGSVYSTPAISVQGSGNVGIGTTLPTSRLHIYGTDETYPQLGIAVNDNAGKKHIGLYTAGNVLQSEIFANTSGNMGLMFNTGDGTTTNAMFISRANQNIGIGTTNPTSKLQVNGAADTDIFTAWNPNANQSHLGVAVYQNYARLQSYGDGSGSGHLSINPLGNNVGIGTTTPTEKLDVYQGTIKAGTTSVGGSTILVGDYAGANYLNVFGGMYSSGGTMTGYAVKPKNGNSGFVSSAGNSNFGKSATVLDGDGFKVFTGASSTIPIGNDVTMNEKFKVDNGGNVTINSLSTGLVKSNNGVLQNAVAGTDYIVTEVDGSITNEIQTLSVASNTTTLSNGGGSMTIIGGGINTVTTNGSNITVTGLEVDGSVTNEIELPSQAGNSGKWLTTDGTTPSWANFSGLTGTGTANYITKWNGANSLTNSQIHDSGTTVGIGGIGNNLYKLDVNGKLRIANTSGNAAVYMAAFDNNNQLVSTTLPTSGVSSVTATSPIFSSGGTTPNITIQDASTIQKGAASFNGFDFSSSNGDISYNRSQSLSSSQVLPANNVQFAQNGMIFEGSTADQYETYLTPINPTADNTISLPNASGTLLVAEVDGSVTNEGFLGVSAGSTTSSVVQGYNSGGTVTGTGVTINAGTGMTISETTSTNGGTINLGVVDQSTTNEIQTLSLSTSDNLSISSGNSVSLDKYNDKFIYIYRSIGTGSVFNLTGSEQVIPFDNSFTGNGTTSNPFTFNNSLDQITITGGIYVFTFIARVADNNSSNDLLKFRFVSTTGYIGGLEYEIYPYFVTSGNIHYVNYQTIIGSEGSSTLSLKGTGASFVIQSGYTLLIQKL